MSDIKILIARIHELESQKSIMAKALEDAQSWLGNISSASDSKGYTEVTINLPLLEITFKKIEQALAQAGE